MLHEKCRWRKKNCSQFQVSEHNLVQYSKAQMRNDTFFIVDLDRGKRLTDNDFSKNKCKKIVSTFFSKLKNLTVWKGSIRNQPTKWFNVFFVLKCLTNSTFSLLGYFEGTAHCIVTFHTTFLTQFFATMPDAKYFCFFGKWKRRGETARRS